MFAGSSGSTNGFGAVRKYSTVTRKPTGLPALSVRELAVTRTNSRLPQSPATDRLDPQQLCAVAVAEIEPRGGGIAARHARDEQRDAAVLEEAARGEGRERGGDRHDVAVPASELAPVGDEARCGGTAFRRTDDAGSTRADAFDRAWSARDLLDVYPRTEILRHGAILVRQVRVNGLALLQVLRQGQGELVGPSGAVVDGVDDDGAAERHPAQRQREDAALVAEHALGGRRR